MRRLLIGTALILLGISAWILVSHGGTIKAGRIAISATQPGRPAVIAFILLLISTVVRPKPPRAGLWFAVSLIGLMASQISLSNVRRVGDSAEYLAMALSVSNGSAPSVGQSVIAQMPAFFPGDTGMQVVDPNYRGTDGRQDYTHFWLYSALAAPAVFAALRMHVHPLHGFTVLNCVLLLAAASVLWRYAAPEIVLLYAAGPIFWWLDKAHTEVFTFSLLTIALATLAVAPWWSILAFGAAATQNAPIAVAMIFAAVLAAAVHRRTDARPWIALAVGVILAVLNPAYYYMRLGIWSTLRGAIDWHWPSIRELTAVMFDLNIGMLVAAPLFTLAVLGALIVIVAEARHTLMSAVNITAVLVAVVFLFVFSQATNINSGGTPGPSRYGLWLLPAAIPFLVSAPRLADRTWFRLISCGSVLWCAIAFAPRLPDNNLRPTAVASTVWRRFPSLDNPLAEIFAERVSGTEPAALPATTSNCEKVLLLSRASGTRWPERCVEATVPPKCREPGKLCYANFADGRYHFTLAPTSPSWLRDRLREP